MAKAAVASRRRIVADWTNRPDFTADVEIKGTELKIVTTTKSGKRLGRGNATTADLWNWIDETGTRPHTIQAKNPSRPLTFQAGTYQARTGARPARYGGPGTVVNPQTVRAKKVNHPGFKPRKFSEAIDRDLIKDMRKALQRANRKFSKR